MRKFLRRHHAWIFVPPGHPLPRGKIVCAEPHGGWRERGWTQGLRGAPWSALNLTVRSAE